MAMSATLPHGLITIGHANVTIRDQSHQADVLFERSNVLHSFWKVHAVRYRVSKDSSDFRCQNLFWRTWGDSRLSKTIDTAKLTNLWTSCQQSIDSDSLRERIDIQLPRSKPTETPSPHPPDILDDSTSDGFTASSVLSPVSSTPQSVITSGLSGRRTSVDATNSITTDSSKRLTKTPRPALSRAGSSGLRTPFGPSSSRTKNRPILNRRKSSQGATQSRPTKLGRQAKSPTLTSKDTERAGLSPPAMTKATFELPSASSWEDEPTLGYSHLSTSTSCTGTPSELVEPNFRNRFSERMSSSSNLASLPRIKKTGSVVRFADEVPTDLRKVREADSDFKTDIERRPSLSYRSSAASIASVAIIDEDDAPSGGLQRTKSQLSLMIEEDRSNRRKGSVGAIPSDIHAISSNERKQERTEEQRLLAMAHGEGATRAGGRRVRKAFKFSDEDESRYSSPSPPPLF